MRRGAADPAIGQTGLLTTAIPRAGQRSWQHENLASNTASNALTGPSSVAVSYK
jgi:hypothetical protein